MPPRWLCIGVITFWLASTGWLVWSELREAFDADETPPFVIDLTDEVRTGQEKPRWFIWLPEVARDRPEKRPFQATTWIEHRESDDTFALKADYNPDYRPLEPTGVLDFGLIKLNQMKSTYRVDRNGHMVAAEAEFLLDLPPVGKNLTVALQGEVRGDQFYGKFDLDLNGAIQQEHELEPVPVSRRGSVLLPMHPVNKITGLRLGQTWKMPLIDPLGDALAATVHHSTAARILRVRVLPDLEKLPPVDDNLMGPVSRWICYVIEYDGDIEGKPRTWVRAADGLVLRQDSEFLGKHLVMHRSNIPNLKSEP